MCQLYNAQVGVHSRGGTLEDTTQSPLPVAALSFDQAATHDKDVPSPSTSSPQQLLSLWDWYSRQQGWSLSPVAPLPTLGSFVWAAHVQPDAALRPDTCCLFGNVVKAVADSGQDCSIVVYDTSQAEVTPTQPGVMRDGSKGHSSKQVVYMRMLLDQNTGARQARQAHFSRAT